jgi:catechol 2,3-dioxygenase-like lactoylglutathione lyase family enzyme
MHVEQVDFVSVPTRDAARAVAWYRDVLGLRLSDYTEGEVETANVTLSFWNPEADGEPFQPNTAGIGLRVADVEAAVEEVRATGAEVIGIEDSGVCHMGFVKDLDGNVLILHRRYVPRSRAAGGSEHGPGLGRGTGVGIS